MTSPLEAPLRKLKQKGSFYLQVCLLYAVVLFQQKQFIWWHCAFYYCVEKFYSMSKSFLLIIYSGQHRTACLDEVQKLKMGSSEVSELAEGDAGYTAPSCIASLSLSGILEV